VRIHDKLRSDRSVDIDIEKYQDMAAKEKIVNSSTVCALMKKMEWKYNQKESISIIIDMNLWKNNQINAHLSIS